MTVRGRSSGTEVTAAAGRPESLWVYGLVGLYLGAVFIKSEVASWYRIQEMFRFQAVHMFGIIGSAVIVGAVALFFMKRTGTRTVRGEEIEYPSGEETRPRLQHIVGGTLFGLGWGLVGVCPGPMFALIGAGTSVILVALLGAVFGAWSYGLLRPKLPHG